MKRILLLVILVCGWTTLAGDVPRPNILFIITDQQSADAMSCRMGSQYIKTPVMDRLAGESTLFTRAYSSNPLCMPWRNSVFTGRYPHQTRITRNENPPGGLDPAKFVSMGTYFRNAGYDTAYSGKWHLSYNIKDSQAHGFEIVTGNTKANYDTGTAEGAMRFLERRHAKPFMLVVSFLNPHNICEWSRRLAGRNQALNCGEIGEPPPLAELPPLPANAAPPRGGPDGMTLMRKAYQVDSGLFPVGKFEDVDWRKLRWGYYRMIEKVDAEMGKVLEALRQAGLQDNTLVVFTSDHGECAGAHGFNQKTVLYDESARVPLIISFKGKTRGAVRNELVNTGIDLLPTMLDAAGIEVPQHLPGLSLAPLTLGRPAPWKREFIVVQNDMAQAGALGDITPQMDGRMVRTERFKYCVYSWGAQRESLIDMQADPGEMTDLATNPKYWDVMARHRQLLAAYGREHGDALVPKLLTQGPVRFTDTKPAAKPVRKKPAPAKP